MAIVIKYDKFTLVAEIPTLALLLCATSSRCFQSKMAECIMCWRQTGDIIIMELISKYSLLFTEIHRAPVSPTGLKQTPTKINTYLRRAGYT